MCLVNDKHVTFIPVIEIESKSLLLFEIAFLLHNKEN